MTAQRAPDSLRVAIYVSVIVLSVSQSYMIGSWREGSAVNKPTLNMVMPSSIS